ncbi:MAG: transketolase family protein [Firmicutes bacterium]|nr:transketolase family protein [Bacillota bacterium]
MADKIATRDSFSKFLVEYGKTHKNVVVMNADLSCSTQTRAFEQTYPERFVNVGIAEQNLMGMACGLAMSGNVVFASTFAMFATGRAYEIVRNAIAYSGANVKVCASHAGLMVGEDGATHQAIEDLALMSVIPGMIVVNPSDDVSARKLLAAVAEINGPAYVRLGRAATPVLYKENARITLGKAVKLKDGKDATIIATGTMVAPALEAAEELKKQGIEARVLDMHTIKPIDKAAILKAAKETGAIVTAEEHSIYGGLGSIVASVLAENYPCRLKMVAVKDSFGESGKADELLKKYGLTAKDIVKAVKSLKK